jgi:hypothetical protein
MELVEGPTVAELLRRGGLGWRIAASLGHDVADALGHAHRHGTVHRDLKPSNVLVSQSGVVKLVDFGLAKQIAMPEPGEDEATVYEWSEVHTADGAVLGTPAYMSPEQARAKPIDARADVFALGALMHELVTGVAIFRRASPAATIGAILASKPPRLDAIDRNVPTWFADLVSRCLEKEPDARFADGETLAAAIAAGGAQRVDLRVLAQEVSAERITVARTSRPSLHPASLVPPPRVLTRFVGRAVERRWLHEAAARDEPIVVLHGPAGSGKSRLVREHLEERGEDDAFVVDVSLATSDALVVTAVAAALGASRHERIGVRLALRESPVVVIDGLTRSPDGVLALVREWSAAAPRARFIVTSERPAATRPEAALAVDGLAIDEACELLLERLMARADDPPRVLDQRDRATRIAEDVLGVPLALELLATLATPDAAPDLAPVEAALHGDGGSARTSEWSSASSIVGVWPAIDAVVSSLSPSEREAFASLAIVPAFDAGAAAAIASLPASEVEPLLAKLLALGLTYAAPHPDLVGVPRWAMREPVRRRARQRFGDLHPRATKRAAKHYAVHAHARREAMRAAPSREAHREVALDEAGVLAIADAAIDDPSLAIDELALEALVAQIEGRPAGSASLLFLHRLDALLDRSLASRGDAEIVLDAVVARAMLRLDVGAGEARDEADRALAWALRREDQARIARARTLMARALLAAGELRAASTESARAAAEARAADRPAELGTALEVLARAALESGHVTTARAATDEARALAITRDDPAARLRAVVLAASVARESNDPRSERAHLEEALEASRAFGLVEGTAAILLELGELEHREGSVARAGELFTQAAALHPELTTTADALRLAAAALAVERGEVSRASALAAVAMDETDRSALELAIAGGAAAALGDVEAATRLFDRSLAQPSRDTTERAAVELWRGHLDMLEQPGEQGILRATARLDGLRVPEGDARPGSRHALRIAMRVLEARLPRRASLVP